MSKDNIVIIGGGIAGMTAASRLLRLGYTPIIVEESDHLGGHVAEWHKLFPDMAPAQDIVQRLAEEVSAANIFLSTRVLFINRLHDTYIVMLNNGVSIQAQAVLIATGFNLFDATKKEEYGYGIYDQVLTNRDLERWFTTGDDPRLNGHEVKRAGFVHCVGSRDVKAGNTQCSKVCCVTAIKQAIELKEKFPDAEIWCFYMDLRLFGKKYEDFYINAQKDYGIHFIRGRVSEVSEGLDGRVIVKAEDTLSGKPVKVTLDLLVLMSGMVCNATINPIATSLGIDLDSDGFLRSKDNISHIVSSGRKGLFLAGACTGTKTVPETIAEANSAALDIHLYLTEGK
ncbi:MAG: CoB--CoM heterodisulfide reductase iron-sulfur subunit A family protein [Bacteroidales bacterium]|nr:CoB--CoM heterodisulfide reductase iron-sulfur subunit A family protein [Bacteroidales bacterium]